MTRLMSQEVTPERGKEQAMTWGDLEAPHGREPTYRAGRSGQSVPDLPADQATRLLAEAQHPEAATFGGTVVHIALSFDRLLTSEEHERLNDYLIERYSAAQLDLPDGAPVTSWPSTLLSRSGYCWRCDAVPATTEVGCCSQCLADLQVRATELGGTTEAP